MNFYGKIKLDMKFPDEILFNIESFCDVVSRSILLNLNKHIRSILITKYYGYVLYSDTSSLVYDSYKVTIHRNKKKLDTYIKNNHNEKHIMSRHVRFTNLGRFIVEEHPSMRIFDETAYIHSCV